MSLDATSPHAGTTDSEVFDDLLGEVPLPRACLQQIRDAMAGADRHYHGTRHLADLWRLHRRHAAGAALAFPAATRLIASAVAFHDAVYDSRRQDNEQRSADLWLACSRDARLSAEDRAWVAGTILATADHFGPDPAAGSDGDRRPWLSTARDWVVDLDLTPLGASRDRFDENTIGLRAEFSHVDLAVWNTGRLAFLARCGRQTRIFRSPILCDRFEAAARDNIRRHLAAPCLLASRFPA